MSSLDKKLKIYLAGSMSACDSFEEMNEWRVEMTVDILKLADIHGYSINIINPVDLFNLEEVKYESQREVKEYDLAHVLSSDIVIVDLNKIEQSPGTIIETGTELADYISYFYLI